MDAAEFMEWQRYYAEDPFGDQRQDQRFAMICQVVAALAGKPPPLQNFMLYPDRPTRRRGPVSAAEISAALSNVRDWMTHGHDSRQTANHSDG